MSSGEHRWKWSPCGVTSWQHRGISSKAASIGSSEHVWCADPGVPHWRCHRPRHVPRQIRRRRIFDFNAFNCYLLLFTCYLFFFAVWTWTYVLYLTFKRELKTCKGWLISNAFIQRFILPDELLISLKYWVILLLLGGELVAERCRTDDLLPSIPISCLPPCCMDRKVLRPNILISCSQPGGLWATDRSPPVCWWS